MKGDVFEPNALVFAKIRGYPAWPAKVTAALDESKKPKKYSVFFFGTYEVAAVKVEDLFAYDEKTKAKYGSAGIKRKGFAEALVEIETSPDIEVQIPVTALIKPPATPRSGAGSATSTPSSTPKPRGRGRKRKDDDSTPLAPVGKRRRVDSGSEPDPLATPTAEPVLSRSGRKIKPKRFADEEGRKAKTPGSAAGKRAARAAAAAAASAAAASAAVTVAAAAEGGSDAEADPDEPEPEKEEPLDTEDAAEGGDEEPMQQDGAGGDAPVTLAPPKDVKPVDPAPPEVPRRDVRYKLYPAHETEDIIRVVDSADVQNTDGRKVMYVRAKCGELLEIDLSDKERPKEFKSEKARIMWDTATVINLRRLRYSIEQGHCIPDRLREKLLARADLADDMRQELKSEKKRETRRSKLWWLRDEARLIELDYHIKMNLIIDQQNHERCAESFKEVIAMSMAPLMLKKNPDVVETARKCRKYRHSAEIRDLAEQAYKRFKKMFVVPAGRMFREYFDEQVAVFRKLTEEMEEHKVIGLVRDPLYKRPGEAESDSDDDIWPPGVPKGKLRYRHNGASNGDSTGEESPAVHGDGAAGDAPDPKEENVTIPADASQPAHEESMDTDGGVEDLGGKTIPAGEEEVALVPAAATKAAPAETAVTVAEPATEPTPENATETVSQDASEAVSQEATEAAPEATTEAASQDATEAVSEPTIEATPEATTEAAPETTTEAVLEATTEAAPEATTEAAPEATIEAAPEATTEAAPEATTEAAPEATTEAVPEATTEAGHEVTTEVVPEDTPDVPELAAEAIPEQATAVSELATGDAADTPEAVSEDAAGVEADEAAKDVAPSKDAQSAVCVDEETTEMEEEEAPVEEVSAPAEEVVASPQQQQPTEEQPTEEQPTEEQPAEELPMDEQSAEEAAVTE